MVDRLIGRVMKMRASLPFLDMSSATAIHGLCSRDTSRWAQGRIPHTQGRGYRMKGKEKKKKKRSKIFRPRKKEKWR